MEVNYMLQPPADRSVYHVYINRRLSSHGLTEHEYKYIYIFICRNYRYALIKNSSKHYVDVRIKIR